MNTAITWLMLGSIPPPPGELLAPARWTQIRFIVVGEAVVLLIWEDDRWIAQWGYLGSHAAQKALDRTAYYEGQGFRLIEAVHLTDTEIGAEKLYRLAPSGKRVDVERLLPEPWRAV